MYLANASNGKKKKQHKTAKKFHKLKRHIWNMSDRKNGYSPVSLTAQSNIDEHFRAWVELQCYENFRFATQKQNRGTKNSVSNSDIKVLQLILPQPEGARLFHKATLPLKKTVQPQFVKHAVLLIKKRDHR